MVFHDPVWASLSVAAFLLLVVGLILTIGFLLPRPRRRVALPHEGTPAERGASWLSGMARTRGNLAQRLLDAWGGAGKAEQWLVEVEQILLSSDVGIKATSQLLERLRAEIRKVESADALRQLIRRTLRDLVADPGDP